MVLVVVVEEVVPVFVDVLVSVVFSPEPQPTIVAIKKVVKSYSVI